MGYLKIGGIISRPETSMLYAPISIAYNMPIHKIPLNKVYDYMLPVRKRKSQSVTRNPSDFTQR